MRVLYSGALSATLILGGLRAQGQATPAPAGYLLGTTQAVVQELEASAKTGNKTTNAATGRLDGKPTVTLRVGPKQAFTGLVNYRQDLGATGEYLVGELPGVPDGSFYLRIEGKVVDGNIVLRREKRAYRYLADEQGNVRVQEVDIDKVICVDFNPAAGAKASAAGPTAAAARATPVPLLQSFPGAKGCVMLDFDGQYVAGTPWNKGNPIDAAPSPLTDAQIQTFWEGVSEDYRPFNLNITTDENVFNSYPKNLRMRCIVTPTNTAAPGAGGVAYVTSFKGNDDTPCWVFQGGDKFGGDAASHEIGHTLGLSHDGRLNPKEEYYTASDNSGVWCPIMGAAYGKSVTQFSKGEYNRANNQEDDLAIISSATYNVGYRSDDHGNTTGTATALTRSADNLAGKGLIERTTDQDYFSFTTSGGAVSFTVNTVARFGNLDIVARLFDGGGQQIGTFDTPGQLNVSFNATLNAGTYYLQIDGTSAGNPATDGYSDYGSLGTYTIAGTAPAGQSPPPAGGVATFYSDCNYGGAAVALPVGAYSLVTLQGRGIRNDDISSLRVSAGYEVVLYENDLSGGATLTLSADNSCLTGNALNGGTWNDKTSSILVRAASASAFSRQLEAEAATVNNGFVVENCAEGGQDMGYTDAGDYLVWNGVNIPTTGSYLLEYRVASGANGGTISADLNGGNVRLGNTSIPATGGWQTWTTVSKTVTLSAGTVNFGIYAQTSGFNLNWVRITYRGAATAVADATQAAPTPAAGASASAGAVAAVAALELYPNPVTDRLHLQADQDLAGSSFRILDALGRAALSGSAAAGTVDVSGLRAGVYSLVLSTPGQAPLTRRFVK